MDPKYLKKLRKILLIVCGVLILAAAAVFIVRFAEGKKDEKITEEKNNQSKYSYSSYEFNEVGELDPSEVNLDEYVSVKQYGRFYLLDNSEFLKQALESTYVTVIDNEYYIDNKCFSCNLNSSEHYYFFGNDKNNLQFYLKVGSGWDKTEWFVKKDYVPPTVKLNRVSEIIVVSSNDTKELLSKSLDNSDLHRINTEGALKITDREIINQCITCFKKEKYVYDDSFEVITEAKEKSLCGYVLAAFDNSCVYQCIGAY